MGAIEIKGFTWDHKSPCWSRRIIHVTEKRKKTHRSQNICGFPLKWRRKISGRYNSPPQIFTGGSNWTQAKTLKKGYRNNICSRAEFLEQLTENFQTCFEELGKQVLLCTQNLLKSEMWQNFHWWRKQSALSLQESDCDPVTFWTPKNNHPS